MTKRVRRRFSPEYTEQAVARLSEPGTSYGIVAAELGVTATQLKTWKLELDATGPGGGERGSACRGGRSCRSFAAQQTVEVDVWRWRFCARPRLFSLSGRRNHERQLAFMPPMQPNTPFAFSVEGARRLSELVSRLAARGSSTSRARSARRAELVGEIRASFEASQCRHGAPRIRAELRDRGRRLSTRTIAKSPIRNSVSGTAHRPALPPNRPFRVQSGWLGGGAGR